MWNKYGADSLRWFFSSSSILKGQNLQMDMEGKGIADAQRLIITPLWNSFYFFCLYANAENVSAKENYSSDNPLDKYALLKTKELIENINEHLSNYDIANACQSVPSFIDAINNWYIRRSRPRFWKHADNNDSKNAYDTLYTVLVNLTKALSPLLPLISEEIYTKLTKDKSVHLNDWPDTKVFPSDKDFLKKMDIVREIASAGLAIRKSNNIRVRQPLKEITIAGDSIDWIEGFENYIIEEVNTKKIIVDENSDSLYRNKIKINLKKLGPKLGKNVGKFMEAANNFQWEINKDKTLNILNETLQEDEYFIEKESLPGTETREISEENIVVSLNINIDKDLEIEGVARDILRAIQSKRKDLDLKISDKIIVNIFGEQIIKDALDKFKNYISSNSLAESIIFSKTNGSQEIKISESYKLDLKINKI